MAGKLHDLENTKFVIRALLMVNNGPTSFDNFVRDYRRSEGHNLPYQKYGYTDCIDFLRSLTDAVHVEVQGRNVVLLPNLNENAGESVRHVHELIKAQKVSEPDREGQRSRLETARQTRRAELSIPDVVQRNLQNLVSKFRHGISLDAIEDAYSREFGTMLNVRHFGFNSLKDALSTIKFFELVSVTDDKFKVRLLSSNNAAKMTVRVESAVTDVPRANGHAYSPKSAMTDVPRANGYAYSPKSLDVQTTPTSLTKDNVQKVLERSTDGIFMSSFSEVYADEIGEQLGVGTMQLVQRWPDLFHVVRPDSSSDFILFPAALADLEDNSTEARSTEARSSSSTGDKSDLTYSPVQLPADATEQYFPVRVSYIGNPGKFAIQPVNADGHDPLAALTQEMTELYNSNVGQRYAVAGGRCAVVIGQAFAALYSSVDNNTVWYRARVTGISSLHNVEVELVDIGSHCTVHRSELRRLRDDFFQLPVQCARAAFAFLRPKDEGWCESAYKCFVQLATDKILMCKVQGREDETLKVSLCDTNQDEEYFIQDVLVSKGFAKSDLSSPLDPRKEMNGVVGAEQEHTASATGEVDVKPVKLGNGSTIHVIRWRSEDYVASQELSSLVGRHSDCILEELREKGISFRHVIAKSHREPDLFRKIKTFAPGETICLFKAKNVVDVVNIFNYPSAQVVDEIKRLLKPPNGAKSLRGSKVRTGATELKQLREQLAAADNERRRIYSSFAEGATNTNYVDVLQEIEARITGLKQQIERLYPSR